MFALHKILKSKHQVANIGTVLISSKSDKSKRGKIEEFGREIRRQRGVKKEKKRRIQNPLSFQQKVGQQKNKTKTMNGKQKVQKKAVEISPNACDR